MNLGEGTTLVGIARSAEQENGPESEAAETDQADSPVESNASDDRDVITDDGDTPAEPQE